MYASECDSEFSVKSQPRQGLLAWLKRLRAVNCQHRHLAQLDGAALHDLGLTHADVAREVSQPFWMRPDFGLPSQPRQSDAARVARYRRQ